MLCVRGSVCRVLCCARCSALCCVVYSCVRAAVGVARVRGSRSVMEQCAWVVCGLWAAVRLCPTGYCGVLPIV